jgi:uncharacterized protein (TIGR00255 family)
MKLDKGLNIELGSAQIQSMTGFAQVVNRINLGPELATENATLLLELRSVNSRYLDLTFKVPDELRHFESLLREQISAKVKRGKLECRVSLKRDNLDNNDSLRGNKLNKEALTALFTAHQEVIATALTTGLHLDPPNALDVLRWPGVWGKADANESMSSEASLSDSPQLDRQTLVAIVDQTLAEFTKSRLREGAQTAKAMLQYGNEIETLVLSLEAKLPHINAEVQKRFSDKVWERLLGTSSDTTQATNADKVATLLKTEDAQSRINQELVLMAMRADVSEEISRLKAHIAELRKTLSGSGAVGKKLDFLMQEFNREANTLGSKAPNLEVSKASTELKLAIEQIREQVQNLE